MSWQAYTLAKTTPQGVYFAVFVGPAGSLPPGAQQLGRRVLPSRMAALAEIRNYVDAELRSEGATADNLFGMIIPGSTR